MLKRIEAKIKGIDKLLSQLVLFNKRNFFDTKLSQILQDIFNRFRSYLSINFFIIYTIGVVRIIGGLK